MKNVLQIAFILVVLVFNSNYSFAQTDDEKGGEAYSRANIAFTNFRLLGVNASEYVKCVESVNFPEPSKRHKLIIIGEEIFTDDGQHYDLRANDGILTSTGLSKYHESITPIEPGKYRNAKQDIIIYDESFVHIKNPGIAAKLKIECNLIWVPCSQMTGAQQALCNIIGWPWGIFILKDCKITWE